MEAAAAAEVSVKAEESEVESVVEFRFAKLIPVETDTCPRSEAEDDDTKSGKEKVSLVRESIFAVDFVLRLKL